MAIEANEGIEIDPKQLSPEQLKEIVEYARKKITRITDDSFYNAAGERVAYIGAGKRVENKSRYPYFDLHIRDHNGEFKTSDDGCHSREEANIKIREELLKAGYEL